MIKNSKDCLRNIAWGAMLLLLLASCKKEFNDLDLEGANPNFDTDMAYFKVTARNKRLNSVQTNGVSVYQIGKYTDEVFGEQQSYIVSQLTLSSTSPRFGLYSQEREMADDTITATVDEQETVTRVYLDIPFFTNVATDEDGNAVLDDNDFSTYELDSIYGNKAAEFDFRVHELRYYLGDYEAPDFTSGAKYFSSDPTPDFLNSYAGNVLADSIDATITAETIKIYKEDDPDTEEDESTEVESVLAPRLRIDLDTEYFQQHIIDMEDNSVFSSNANFKEYMRGIILSMGNIDDNLLMLLKMTDATITIEYSYRTASKDDNGDIVYDEDNTSTFQLNVAGNILQKTTTTNFPTINTADDAELLYLKGGEGSMVEIDLFEEGDVEMMKEENWLINEANLTFYVNREVLDNGNVIEPNRIYLYSMANGTSTPLVDYGGDITSNSSSPYYSKYVHGGIIEKNDDGQGIEYKIRLTEHVNRIVRSDSTNVRLGLVVLSNINTVVNSSTGLPVRKAAKITADNAEVIIPEGSVTNPAGTVINGSGEAVAEDKRLRLQIYYTKPSN